MMLLKTIFFILLISLFATTGCSSNEVKITEVFRSHIRTDDSKLFTFSIIFFGNSDSKPLGSDNNNLDKQQKRSRQGKGRGNKSNTEKNTEKKPNKQRADKKQSRQDKMMKELEARMAEKLADNSYCRKGFFELERSLNKTIFTIHGECNESATAADRENFPQVKRVD